MKAYKREQEEIAHMKVNNVFVISIGQYQVSIVKSAGK